MKIIFSFLSIIFLTLLFNDAGNAQITLAGWDVSAQTGGTNNFGTSPLAVTDQALNVTIGSMTRGSGVGTTGTGAARGWGGNNWNVTTSALAISGNKFATFTVKANSGYKVSLSAINPFDYRRSATGPPSGLIQYSLDGATFTDIATVSFPTSASTGDHVGATDLSVISALQNVSSATTITFRIIPYGASGAAGTWYIFDVGSSAADDFVLTGTVTAAGAPYLTLGGSLSAFSQSSAIPSAEQSYNISGTGLTTNVTVVPPAGFEISKTTSTGFVNSTGSLVYTAAEVIAGKTIYVRMNAGSPGNYSGNITHASSDFTTVNRSVSGIYTPSCVLSLTALIQGYYNGSVMVPDSVTVELHDASSLALVDQNKGLLSASGTGTFTFSSAVNGSNYYIAVKHKNSIETWSASVQSFTSYALNYNFTTASTQSYGSNLILKGSKYCIYSGDVNQDGGVDITDVGAVFNDNFVGIPGGASGLPTDLNGDGGTDISDIGIVYNNNLASISKNTPTLSSVLSLTGTLAYFTQTSATPSVEQTYNISGIGLSTNVTVVPPAGFEISKTTGTGFVNSTGSLVYTAGDVMAGKTIYVRLNAGSPGSYSGNITHTSAGSEFTPVTQAVSGTYLVISSNVNLTMGNPSNATIDINNPHNYLLDKPQFCASYDRDKGIPNWTSWQLNSTWCNGPAVRQDNYITDPTLPAGWHRVGGSDYSGSGFSRGHMCPSADRLITQADNDALFVMTNLVPQNQDNNSGAWEGLENYERTLANAGNVEYIISGGYGAGGTGTNGYATTISNGTVTVPAKLWKVIIVLPAGTNDVSRVTVSTRTIAIIIPNDSTPNSMSAWGNYRVSVDSVEALTGYDFFSNVSTSIQAVIEANPDTGPTN